jgi:hypothetical protein
MGSFGGAKIDLQNFEQTVNLAQEKAFLEQQKAKEAVLVQTLSDYRNSLDIDRVKSLEQSLLDYRDNLNNSVFPDGEYYVTSDFNSQLVRFQGDARPMEGIIMPTPVVRNFKKGELVNVVTFVKDMAMTKVKVIQTDTGNFYADQNNLSKTKPAEPVITESKEETKRRNGDNTKIMIAVAFILGYLLSKK